MVSSGWAASKSTTMNKRKEKLRAKIGSFMQQYARKAQRGQELNDRGYSRAVEAKLKRMKPEELDELLNGEAV